MVQHGRSFESSAKSNLAVTELMLYFVNNAAASVIVAIVARMTNCDFEWCFCCAVECVWMVLERGAKWKSYK